METVNRTADQAQEPAAMSEQAKELRRAYKRAWNQANKDKVKQATARYWNRRAEAAAEGACSDDL